MLNLHKLLLIAVLMTIAFSTNRASAQATGNDYYQGHSTPALETLLRNVENFHVRQGMDQVRLKRYAAAWGDFDFILRYFPNHPRGLLLMAELCQVWRSPKCNMADYFQKAIQLSPNNEGIYLTKGAYLQKRGQIDDAIENYKKSLELNPDSAHAHYNLGLAYVIKKQHSVANEHAQKAYELGSMPPGLRDKLIAAGAWKPIAKKPAPEEKPADVATPEKSGGTSASDTRDKPAEAINGKPLENDTRHNEKAHQ